MYIFWQCNKSNNEISWPTELRFECHNTRPSTFLILFQLIGPSSEAPYILRLLKRILRSFQRLQIFFRLLNQCEQILKGSLLRFQNLKLYTLTFPLIAPSLYSTNKNKTSSSIPETENYYWIFLIEISHNSDLLGFDV